MLKALITTRLQALFGYLFKGSKFKKKSNPIVNVLIILLAVYVIGTIFVMFGMLFFNICQPLVENSLKWLYFSLAGIIAFLFSFIGSVFMAQSQLYEARDNDLLLSMPIPVRYVLASRIAMLYVMAFICQLFVVLPAEVIYVYYYGFNFIQLLVFFMVNIVLPFFAITMDCMVGFVISFITSRMRRKNIITLVISISFLLGYFYLYSKMSSYIQALVEKGNEIGMVIKTTLYPVYYYGIAVGEMNYSSMIYFFAWSLIPFCIVCFVLTKSFLWIATSKPGVRKIRYKEKSMKVASVKWALISKEMRHFIGNPMYVLNGALGLVMMLILAVMVIIKKDDVITILDLAPELKNYFPAAVCLGLTVCVATNIISAPSISLEGKNLWILKAIPVSSKVCLLAKAQTHIYISLPFCIISSIMTSIFLECSLIMKISILLMPIAMTVFCGFFGVLTNLRFPKFDWISETVAIKQGLSTTVSMLGNFLVVAICVVPYLVGAKDFINLDLYMLISLGFITMLGVVCYILIITKGVEMFENL